MWRQSARRWWYHYEWPVVGALAVTVVMLGSAGFHLQFAREGRPIELFDLIFKSVQLFVLETNVDPPMPWQLNAARFLAPLIAGYTALQALGRLFAGQLNSLRLRLRRGHVVIGGLGRKGWALARALLERGQTVVVIERDVENAWVGQCRDLGGMVLIGDATEPWLLRQAGVPRAKHLFALCGDDGVNSEIAVQAAALLDRRSGSPLTCVLHIFDPGLCGLLRERELEPESGGRLRLEYFNVYDLAARILLEEHPLTSANSDSGPADHHLVIVGVGRLGESLLIHAARQWHAAGLATNRRLRVTLIDPDARDMADRLAVRHPGLKGCCELEPRNLTVHSGTLQQAEFIGRRGQDACPARVFICLDNDSLGLSAALELARHRADRHPPIVVCLTEEAGLASLLRGGETGNGSFRHLRAFGVLDRACHPDQVLRGTREILAHAIHGEYLRQQRAAGVTREQNPSVVSWGALPEQLKESNRQQADDIGVKLKAVGCGVAPLIDWDEPLFAFDADEIERLARLEHERWMRTRLEEGWRYGPKKDRTAKTHPCLLPYDRLPPAEQDKDRDAVRQIPHRLAQVGFRVHRLKGRLCPAASGDAARLDAGVASSEGRRIRRDWICGDEGGSS